MTFTKAPGLGHVLPLKWVARAPRPTCNSHYVSRCFIAAAVTLLLLALHSTLPPNADAQRAKVSEYAVKAAYLYNFGKFIEWPVASDQLGGGSFAICVLGHDPFGSALEAAIGHETLAGKRVVARQIDTARDATDCRVLFISSSEESRLKEILARLGGASVLTVSDLPAFTQRGGMVQFVLQDDRVRFEVNASSAERAGLTLSSDLLKVAVNVRRSAQSGD